MHFCVFAGLELNWPLCFHSCQQYALAVVAADLAVAVDSYAKPKLTLFVKQQG